VLAVVARSKSHSNRNKPDLRSQEEYYSCQSAVTQRRPLAVRHIPVGRHDNFHQSAAANLIAIFNDDNLRDFELENLNLLNRDTCEGTCAKR